MRAPPREKMPSRPRELRGKEIVEIQPVIFGGHPTDPANKAYLTRSEHIEAVRYWNRMVRELRRGGHQEEHDSVQT